MLSRIREVARLPYFKTAVAAWAGLGAVFFMLPAEAADLGGNCCNDLEERVAELEATAAKKGNRKVSVRIYGQVNKAVLWADGLLADQDKNVIDNSASPTHFGVSGSGKIDKDWSAGFVIEIGLGGADIPILQDEMQVRHALVYVEHKMLNPPMLGAPIIRIIPKITQKEQPKKNGKRSKKMTWAPEITVEVCPTRSGS